MRFSQDQHHMYPYKTLNDADEITMLMKLIIRPKATFVIHRKVEEQMPLFAVHTDPRISADVICFCIHFDTIT